MKNSFSQNCPFSITHLTHYNGNQEKLKKKFDV